MKHTLIALTALASLCLLVFILDTTTPLTAGPLGILVVFVLAYVLSVMVIAYFIYWISILANRISSVLISRKPFEILELRKSYYYSSVISAAPVMLIGLQSVGSVGFYEIFLVSLFVIIGCLYISKRVN